MDFIINLDSWQTVDVVLASFVTLVVLLSLGFSLWKALADSQSTPYWNVSSMLTGLGAVALAVTASRVASIDALVNISMIILSAGVFMAVCGAIYDCIHRYNLHRKDMNYHAHFHG